MAKFVPIEARSYGDIAIMDDTYETPIMRRGVGPRPLVDTPYDIPIDGHAAINVESISNPIAQLGLMSKTIRNVEDPQTGNLQGVMGAYSVRDAKSEDGTIFMGGNASLGRVEKLFRDTGTPLQVGDIAVIGPEGRNKDTVVHEGIHSGLDVLRDSAYMTGAEYEKADLNSEGLKLYDFLYGNSITGNTADNEHALIQLMSGIDYDTNSEEDFLGALNKDQMRALKTVLPILTKLAAEQVVKMGANPWEVKSRKGFLGRIGDHLRDVFSD